MASTGRNGENQRTQKSLEHLLEKRAEHPPAGKQGRGVALSRYRDNATPLPCFPAGILERYRSHKTNYIVDINKLLIEY